MHPSNIPALFSSSLYTQSGNPNQTPSSSHSSSANNPNHSADSEPSSAQSSASNSRANSPVSANHFGSNKSPFHQPSSRASAGSTTSSAAAAAQAAQAARMFQSISLNNNPSNSSMSVSPTQLTASAAARMKSEGENENGDDVMEDANEGSNKRRLHLSPAAGFSTLKLKRKLRKNTREKQRRSEINERFDRLSDLLHLTNPSANSKVEKFTVLSEAFNCIENLRKECAMLKTEKSELKLEIHKLNNLIPHLTLLQPGAINSMSELEALRAINLNLSSTHNTTTPGMGVRMLGGVMSPLVSPRATMAIAHPGPHGPPGVVGANGTPTPVAMATVVNADPNGAGNGAFFSTSPPSSNRPLYSSGASSRPIAKPMTPAVTAVPTYRVTRANTLPSAAPPYGNMGMNHAGHPPPTLNLQQAAQTASPNNIMRANVVNANANGNSSMDTQNMNQNVGHAASNGVPNQPAPMVKTLLPAQPPLMSSTAQSAAAFSASSTSSMVTSSSAMPTLNPMVAVTSPPLVYNTLSSPPTSTSTLGVGLNMNLLHRPSVSDRVDFSQRRDSITSSMLVAERRRSLAERRSSFNYGNFGAMSSIGTLPSLTERRPSLPSLSSVFDRRGSITAGLMNASNTIQQALQEKEAQQNNPSSSATAANSSSSSGGAVSASNSLHPKVHHPHAREGSTAPLNVLLGNLPQVDQIDTLPSMPNLDHLHQNDQNDIFFGNMDDESLALNSFQ